MITYRPGKIIMATTIDDIPDRPKKERKRDFHAMIRDSLYEKFAEACEQKGYERNELLDYILESFLNPKKP